MELAFGDNQGIVIGGYTVMWTQWGMYIKPQF